MTVAYPIPAIQTSTAHKTRRRRRAEIVLALLVMSFVFMQFIPGPARTNPPVIRNRTLAAAVPAPRHVTELLGRACANCHSNQTRWPWYSRIAPLSWMIGTHVREGREGMNLSEWPGAAEDDDESRALGAAKLTEACAALESGLMPPSSYLFMHPEARLSAPDKRAICEWVRTAAPAILSRR